MPRIRSIKPEFWCDATIATFDFFTRLFYIALWNFADDEGRGRAIVRELAGFAFPLDDDLPNAQIELAVRALAKSGRILLYDVSGVRHFQIVNWKEHQNINRPTASRFPAYSGPITQGYPDPAERALRAGRPMDANADTNCQLPGTDGGSINDPASPGEYPALRAAQGPALCPPGIHPPPDANANSDTQMLGAVLSARETLTDGSRIPPLPLSEPSVSAHGPLTDASSEVGGRRGEVGIRNQELGIRSQERGCGSEERAQSPHPTQGVPGTRRPGNGSAEELLSAKHVPQFPGLKGAVAYCLEIGGSEEQASKFWDHFKTHGWQIRGSPILDWQARLRNWLHEDEKDPGKRAPPPAGNGHGSSTLAGLSKQNEERLRLRRERKAQGERHVQAE